MAIVDNNPLTASPGKGNDKFSAAREAEQTRLRKLDAAVGPLRRSQQKASSKRQVARAIITASSSHPCLVKGCPGVIEIHGFCCKSCWAKLPEGVQRELPRVIAGRELSRGMKEHVIGQSLARLACEIAGPLSEAELEEANKLTPLCHAFDTFGELLNANNGYWPKWSVQDLKGEEYRNTCRLADLYDRAMVARGDARRATRLGFAGL